MPIYKRGPVQIHYEEAGSGFPLLVIPGLRAECDDQLSVREDAIQPDVPTQ